MAGGREFMNGTTILVAAKKFYNRMKIKKIAGIRKWEVIEATSGSEAISKFKESKASIAILEVELQGSNGFETAVLLLQGNPDAKIVLCGTPQEHGKVPPSLKELPFFEEPVALERLLDTCAQLMRIKMR